MTFLIVLLALVAGLALGWLTARDAALCHYKVCSTFDSSPAIGSIGRAIEIGRAVFGEAPVPLLLGAPQILVVAPPPLGRLSPLMALFFAGAEAKSRQLPAAYATIASANGCRFLDSSLVVSRGDDDGVHIDGNGQRALGLAVGKLLG